MPEAAGLNVTGINHMVDRNIFIIDELDKI